MTNMEFRESLVASLATVFVTKCEGIPNPTDGAKELNFLVSVCGR